MTANGQLNGRHWAVCRGRRHRQPRCRYSLGMQRRSRTRAAVAGVVAVATSLILATTSIASASTPAGAPSTPAATHAPAAGPGTLCGRFPAATEPIYYTFYTSDQIYRQATYEGRQMWNNLATDVKFAGSAATTNVSVHVAGFSNNTWAFVGPFNNVCAGAVNGFWRNNRVTLNYNRNEMRKIDNWMKAIVAGHEFGHTAGLSHPTTTGCNADPSIMHQGSAKFTCAPTPRTQDVNKLNTLYN